MDDAHEAAEEAWDDACDVFDAEADDAAALAVLLEAERRLLAVADERSRERLAMVLHGVVACHVAAGDLRAVLRTAERLVDGQWPEPALSWRLDAALAAVSMGAFPVADADALAGRALALAEGTEDDRCREQVAELLKWRADAVLSDDPAARRALLLRVAEEYGDVDTRSASARERIDDPYFEGRALLDRPGGLRAAEAAFRRAVDAGQDGVWLELGLVLGRQAGREAEEEHALRAALGAQSDPERLAMAGWSLGCLLHYARGDRAGAREVFGRATTGRGEYATAAVKELVNLAVLEGDHRARRALAAELAGRALADIGAQGPGEEHPLIVAATRLGYARPLVRLRAVQWRRQRRREQRRS